MSRMKRKIVVLLFLLLCGVQVLLAISLITRQNKAAEEEEPQVQELEIAWWGNSLRNQRMPKALNLFTEQYPAVTLSYQHTEFTAYWDLLATHIASQTLPDVFSMDYLYYNQYVESQLLLDLSPYIADGTLQLNDVNEALLKTGMTDGKTYAICTGINAPALIYNRTLLDQAGITVPEHMTLSEFAKISKQVYEKTGVKTNYRYRQNIEGLEHMLRGNGKQLFANGQFGVDSAQEFVPYFQIYEQGMQEGWLISPDVFSERIIASSDLDPLVYGADAASRSWCVFSWSDMLSSYQAVAPDIKKFGMAAWPSEHPVRSDYLKPSQFVCVSANSKNPRTAVQLIDFITNSVEYNKIILAECGIPFSSNVADAIHDDLDAYGKQSSDFVNHVIMPCSSSINPSSPAGVDRINAALSAVVVDLCYGKITAQQAAERFFEEGNQLLADPAP